MKRLLLFAMLLMVSASTCLAREHDFSGAYNRPVVPDPEVVEVVAPVFAQLSGHASGDIYVPSNYKIIFGDVTTTDVSIKKSSANTITVDGNLTCTGATCGGGGGGGGASYGTGGGTAQAQTVTPTPTVAALTTGLEVCWLPAAANTAAAPTLAVAGLTAKPITKYGTAALVANDITTAGIACAVYDGTEFQLQVPLAGGVFSSSVTTGSGASAAGPTATGGMACTEAANTGWTPTAGQDYKRCDNTLHTFVDSINGSSETPEPVFSAVPAGGKCLQSSGVAGLIVEAANACAGGGFTTNNVIPKGNGSTLVSSSITDDGTTVTTAEPASIQTLTIGLGTGALSTNTALGFHALFSANTGNGWNTAVGSSALSSNTSGDQTVAVGYGALQLQTTSTRNTGVGYLALSKIATAAFGSTAFGYSSLREATSGPNDAFGYQALVTNTTGTNNVAVGYQAGYGGGANGNVSGNQNTWVGVNTGPNTTTQLSNATALGYLALNSASNQVVLGNASVTDVYDGSITAAAGHHAAGYFTASNCASGASPAVCGSATAGAVAVPTGTNPTLVINTTAVTANSRIFLGIDESLSISATTCNTTLSTLVQPVVTARTAGTSFTIQIGAVIATNPACVSYFLVD